MVRWTRGRYPTAPPKILLSSILDGAEIGSTGSIAMWSYPDVSSVNANKTLNANDNFPPQEFAQAA